MRSILLVDDSRVFLNVMEKLLKEHFNVVGRCLESLQAIEAFKATRPDFVLLDITMPDCSGKDCLQQIMAIDPGARVIMLSSVGDQQTIDECLKAGAKAFVSKGQISASGAGIDALVSLMSGILADETDKEAV